MKRFFLFVTLLLATSFFALANDLDALQGKWTAKKSGDNGPQTMNLEFKKNKFDFHLSSDGGGGFVVKGDVEVKKAGAFSTIRFRATKVGPNETDLSDSDEDRSMVFSMQNGKLYIASNLDLERENETPTIDVYTRTADTTNGANELVGNWKLDLELSDNKFDYTLRIAETDGKLSAVQVSPRSGEHKVKSISFENNVFKMEIDREIDDGPVTFIFTGKLEGKELSGETSAKRDGQEIASGTWKARK